MSANFQYMIYRKQEDRESNADIPEAQKYFAALNENETVSDLLALGDELSTRMDVVLSLWELNNKEDEKLENDFIYKLIDYINRFNYYKHKNGLSDYLHSQTFCLLLKLKNIADCELYISDHQEKVVDCAANIFNHFCSRETVSLGIWFDELKAYLESK